MTIEKLMKEIKRDSICRAELLHQSLQENWSSGNVDEENFELNASQGALEVADMVLLDNIRLTGNVDAIHNVAVMYARKNYYDIACRILRKAIGMKKYSCNVDLLADYLKYSTCFSDDDQEETDIYFTRLMSINRKRWNWRAYEFSIDYKLEELESSPDFYEDKMKEILKLANEYKDKSKDKEYADRAYRELANVYLGDDNQIEGEKILREAVEDIKKAPSCALQLADFYYKRGLYKEAANYIKQCILMNNDLEPSVSMGYPYILYALCMIREVYDKVEEKGNENEEFYKKQIKEIEQKYRSAKMCLGEKEERVVNLKKQIDLLKGWVKDDSLYMDDYGE